MTVTENLKEFKKMLIGIGQENVENPGGLECMTVAHAKAIANYVHIR